MSILTATGGLQLGAAAGGLKLGGTSELAHSCVIPIIGHTNIL